MATNGRIALRREAAGAAAAVCSLFIAFRPWTRRTFRAARLAPAAIGGKEPVSGKRSPEVVGTSGTGGLKGLPCRAGAATTVPARLDMDESILVARWRERFVRHLCL